MTQTIALPLAVACEAARPVASRGRAGKVFPGFRCARCADDPGAEQSVFSSRSGAYPVTGHAQTAPNWRGIISRPPSARRGAASVGHCARQNHTTPQMCRCRRPVMSMCRARQAGGDESTETQPCVRR